MVENVREETVCEEKGNTKWIHCGRNPNFLPLSAEEAGDDNQHGILFWLLKTERV